ncbi:MAG: hypothetical protein V7L21_07620 [Nostoc sp.]
MSANQLLRVMELKQLAKKLGFSRIKSKNKQHVVLETPMEKPAWNLLVATFTRKAQNALCVFSW